MEPRASALLGTLLLAAAVGGGPPTGGVVHAQVIAEEATISGFTIPEVADDGTVRWKLMGKEARLKPGAPADIRGMRLELYRQAQVDMILTSEQCFFDRDKREAETDAPVRIEARNIVITGRGFYWSDRDALLVIRHNARVLIRDARSFLAERPPSSVLRDPEALP